MKTSFTSDQTVLTELAAVLRAIAAERKQSRRFLRDMAKAYETRAAIIPASR